MHELAPVIRALDAHRPRRRLLRKVLTRAAVAVILRETRQGAEVLLVERALRPGDPWSGDTAFPGGRVQAGDDASAARAACRETAEEIGLQINRADGIGRLSDRITLDHRRRAPMIVSPFAYRVGGDTRLKLNHEIAGTQWLALAWLTEPAHRGRLNWRIGGLKLAMPCYACGNGRQLWGLTLSMLDELLDIAQRARLLTCAGRLESRARRCG